MAIAPYRASTEMFRPLFEDLFAPVADGNRPSGMLRAPAADVIETENDIRVVVEMPGIRPDQIIVDIENNVLTISGDKVEQHSEGADKSTWHLTERRYGHFSRSFVLPRDVQQEAIEARFDNGVLTVSIPKSERTRRRRIEINGNGDRQESGTGRT